MKAYISKGELRDASITVPASKSMTHRALICAALADGISFLHGVSENDDIHATINALKQLGASFEKEGEVLKVHGTGGVLSFEGGVIDCGQSASTLRFLIPVFAMTGKKTVFRGHGGLMNRPLDVYRDIFAKQDLLFELNDQQLQIQGPLQAGIYEIDGSISSQFTTGLLSALSLLKEESIIRIRPPFVSVPYVSLTLDVLQKAGINTVCRDLEIRIPSGQSFHTFEMNMAGDDSQAAFFAALAMIRKSPVTVKNMDADSRQADHVIKDLVKDFGGTVTQTQEGCRFEYGRLKAIEADLLNCPDLGPVLFALASQAEGKSVFRNTARIRLKESDRIDAMQKEMKKLGCIISSDDNSVYVEGPCSLKDGAVLDGHHDHRIVMALSVLASDTDSTVIEGAETVSKSWPDFFDALAACGVFVRCG